MNMIYLAIKGLSNKVKILEQNSDLREKFYVIEKKN